MSCSQIDSSEPTRANDTTIAQDYTSSGKKEHGLNSKLHSSEIRPITQMEECSVVNAASSRNVTGSIPVGPIFLFNFIFDASDLLKKL